MSDLMPTGYHPDFDIDLKFGQEGERSVYAAIRAMNQGTVEVKTERYANGNLFIETHQGGGSGTYRPSGINVTKAEFWVYLKPGGIIIFFPTQAIRDYIDSLDEPEWPTRWGTKGHIISVDALLAAQEGRK